MNKEFIPYEQALALKELGFDESCIAFYKDDNNLKAIDQHWGSSVSGMSKQLNYYIDDLTLAPTYSQVFRWFRENHKWQHRIEATTDQHSNKLGYNYWIWNPLTKEEYWTEPRDRPAGDWVYETYEEAELACLNKLIELVRPNE
jgi:hypothetical protein